MSFKNTSPPCGQISTNHNPIIQQNIRESKEEQHQARLLDGLLENVLGYTLNTQPNFILTTALKKKTPKAWRKRTNRFFDYK
jgi:hypothetical protein